MSLVWPSRGLNLQHSALNASTLTITPQRGLKLFGDIQLVLIVCFFQLMSTIESNFIWKYINLACRIIAMDIYMLMYIWTSVLLRHWYLKLDPQKSFIKRAALKVAISGVQHYFPYQIPPDLRFQYLQPAFLSAQRQKSIF